MLFWVTPSNWKLATKIYELGGRCNLVMLDLISQVRQHYKWPSSYYTNVAIRNYFYSATCTTLDIHYTMKEFCIYQICLNTLLQNHLYPALLLIPFAVCPSSPLHHHVRALFFLLKKGKKLSHITAAQENRCPSSTPLLTLPLQSDTGTTVLDHQKQCGPGVETADHTAGVA